MNRSARTAMRLLLMDIGIEHDVVLCRQRARRVAAALGFVPQAQIRIATALSEIARNAFQYGGGGRVEFSFETEPRYASPGQPKQSLVIVVRDKGPGIAALESILEGSYRSKTGLGVGIQGAKRLMDRVEISTSPSGTSVTMSKTLPATSRLFGAAQVQQIVDELLRSGPASAFEEMQVQNQELLQAIDEARQREEEISRINHELSETNAGVLALYDEVETLHRVSVLLASQLDLKALIQSIIDVTTELTNADLGAFFFRSEGEGSWSVYGTAGAACEALQNFHPAAGTDFFGPAFGEGGLHRIANLELHDAPCAASKFASLIAPRFQVRSCLTVPVMTVSNDVLGAMVFASDQPARFTERSERIVGSIATQAVVGIEKSRLFQSVKASSEAKDQFLAMLSHELRTPLNPVLAIVSSWHGDERVPEELRAEVEVVARNIRLEARLIDDLLDFNKLINGKLEIAQAPVNLHQVLESVVEICRADLEASNLHLAVAFEAAVPMVVGDAARLQQVLWNILKNAIKFTPSEGRISICTSNPDGACLRTVISDSGRGIEAGAIDRIFGAFEQGNAHVLAQFGGLGLGLAIAKTFVDRHGGRIFASSAGLDHGSQFTIDLPLTTAAECVPRLPSTPPLGHAGEAKLRILLIEDHVDTLATLTRLLQRRGHRVTSMATAAAAIAEFAEHEFDLIISDLGLPDQTGLELLTKLRTIRFTPAIALSGYGMDADLLESKAAGFDEHLIKPIEFELLIRALKRFSPTA